VPHVQIVPGQFDMEKLVEATVDFSGAELEQAVVAALYTTYHRGRIVSQTPSNQSWHAT
jgi:hypothetical protein